MPNWPDAAARIMKKLTITEAREAARKIADDAEFRRKQFVEAEASDDLVEPPEIRSTDWVCEAEAAQRHAESALKLAHDAATAKLREQIEKLELELAGYRASAQNRKILPRPCDI